MARYVPPQRGDTEPIPLADDAVVAILRSARAAAPRSMDQSSVRSVQFAGVQRGIQDEDALPIQPETHKFLVAPEDLGSRKVKRVETRTRRVMGPEDLERIRDQTWSKEDAAAVVCLVEELESSPDPSALQYPTYEWSCSQRVALLTRVVRRLWPEGPHRAGDAPPAAGVAQSALAVGIAAVEELSGAEVAERLAGYNSYYYCGESSDALE